MKIFAFFLLMFFALFVSMQTRADESYDSKLKELYLKADALKAVADAATKNAKENPTQANKEAADAANYAAAEAVVDAAAFSAIKAIESATLDSEESTDNGVVPHDNDK
jgi:hypothetical protein